MHQHDVLSIPLEFSVVFDALKAVAGIRIEPGVVVVALHEEQSAVHAFEKGLDGARVAEGQVAQDPDFSFFVNKAVPGRNRGIVPDVSRLGQQLFAPLECSSLCGGGGVALDFNSEVVDFCVKSLGIELGRK